MIQYACYQCNGVRNNVKLNNYLKNKKYDFDIKKFYRDFLNMLVIKNEYMSFINNEDLKKILNDTLTADPELRTL